MRKTKYGIIQASKPEFPVSDLLVVPFQGRNLTVSYPALGPSTYRDKVAEMQKQYSHSAEIPVLSFREPTTAESIAAAAYKFETRAQPEIFDPRWLQAGWIVRTKDGVYANPPKDKDGNPITDESQLKRLLEEKGKIKVGNGYVYLGEKDFGFAEYDTFAQGVQEARGFVEGGLAKVLEHSVKPKNLAHISSSKFYERGVNVFEFEPTKEPILRVAGLNSDWIAGGGRLYVCGDCWRGDAGFAFGVLAEGDTKKMR